MSCRNQALLTRRRAFILFLLYIKLVHHQPNDIEKTLCQLRIIYLRPSSLAPQNLRNFPQSLTSFAISSTFSKIPFLLFSLFLLRAAARLYNIPVLPGHPVSDVFFQVSVAPQIDEIARWTCLSALFSSSSSLALVVRTRKLAGRSVLGLGWKGRSGQITEYFLVVDGSGKGHVGL